MKDTFFAVDSHGVWWFYHLSGQLAVDASISEIVVSIQTLIVCAVRLFAVGTSIHMARVFVDLV